MTAIMDLSFPGQRTARATLCILHDSVYFVVNFLSQLIFIFPLLLGMVMYANDFETKEKQKLTATYTCQDYLLESLKMAFFVVICDSQYAKMTPKFVKQKLH